LARDARAALLGVSGGVAAVVAAYATLLPELELNANVFFAVPLRIRAKFLGFSVLAFGVFCWVKSLTLDEPSAVRQAMQGIGPAAIVAGSIVAGSLCGNSGSGACFSGSAIFMSAAYARHGSPHEPGAIHGAGDRSHPREDRPGRIGGLTRGERKLLAQAREKNRRQTCGEISAPLNEKALV
jgi:hypothetical protein